METKTEPRSELKITRGISIQNKKYYEEYSLNDVIYDAHSLNYELTHTSILRDKDGFKSLGIFDPCPVVQLWFGDHEKTFNFSILPDIGKDSTGYKIELNRRIKEVNEWVNSIVYLEEFTIPIFQSKRSKP